MHHFNPEGVLEFLYLHRDLAGLVDFLPLSPLGETVDHCRRFHQPELRTAWCRAERAG